MKMLVYSACHGVCVRKQTVREMGDMIVCVREGDDEERACVPVFETEILLKTAMDTVFGMFGKRPPRLLHLPLRHAFSEVELSSPARP